MLPKLLENKRSVYHLIGEDSELDNSIFRWITALKEKVRGGVNSPAELIDLKPLLSEMRLFKSEAELELMRKAADISVQAHRRLMQVSSKKSHEYQLEAELLHEFHHQGCKASAYDSIVASGANGCVLHYTDNNHPIDENGLILVDAGAEYCNYAADITRTFPAKGRFSPEQKIIYGLVLKAQRAGLAKVKPGTLWCDIQKEMVMVITEGLVKLDLLKGRVSECIEKESFKRFYMHGSGHWLGLDVHDAGSYKKNGDWRPLEVGMALTVEPGIYISSTYQDIDSRWHDIAVRIEDDVVVTEAGHENLTMGIPTEVSDIEALMQEPLDADG